MIFQILEWLELQALGISLNQSMNLNTAMFGEPGTGKSSLTATIIEPYLNTHWVVVIDPHRDIVSKLVAAGMVNDFVLVDFAGEWVTPISPLTTYGRSTHQVALTVIQAFKKIWHKDNEWGQNIQDSMLHATKGAADMGGTLWDAYELLALPAKRKTLKTTTSDESLIAWALRMDDKEKRNRAEFERYYAGSLTRLTAFLSNPMLRATFSGPNPLNLLALAEERKPLFITPFLGDLGEVESRLVASLLLSQLTNLIYSGLPNPILLVADEAHEYITDTFGTLLNLRKFDVAVVLISQGLASYEDQRITNIIRNNCPRKIVFRVSADNAKMLGAELSSIEKPSIMMAEEIRALPDRSFIQKVKELPSMAQTKTPELPDLFPPGPLMDSMKRRYGTRVTEIIKEKTNDNLPPIPDSAQAL